GIRDFHVTGVQTCALPISQVSFQFKPGTPRPFSGWIEIDDDALDLDNRRYFAWNPPSPRRVMMIESGTGAEGWPSGGFIRAALRSEERRVGKECSSALTAV